MAHTGPGLEKGPGPFKRRGSYCDATCRAWMVSGEGDDVFIRMTSSERSEASRGGGLCIMGGLMDEGFRRRQVFGGPFCFGEESAN